MELNVKTTAIGMRLHNWSGKGGSGQKCLLNAFKDLEPEADKQGLSLSLKLLGPWIKMSYIYLHVYWGKWSVTYHKNNWKKR